METWTNRLNDLFRTSWASYRAHWQALTLTAIAPTLPILPLILVLDIAGAWGGLPGILLQFLLSLFGVVPLLILAGVWSQALLLIQLGEIQKTGVALPVGQVWSRLEGRKAALVGTSLLGSFVVLVGMLLFLLPGLVAGWLLAATSAVLIFEGKSGVSAMVRSSEVVRKASLDFMLVACGFSVSGMVLSIVVGMLLPSAVASWAHPLANAALMPLMTFGLAQVYFDVVARENGATVPNVEAPATEHVKGAPVASAQVTTAHLTSEHTGVSFSQPS